MAAVVVNWRAQQDDNTEFKQEIVNLTTAASGDTYTSNYINVITAAQVTPNFVSAPADAYDVTFAANVATINLVGTLADDFTLTLWGTV